MLVLNRKHCLEMQGVKQMHSHRRVFGDDRASVTSLESVFAESYVLKILFF